MNRAIFKPSLALAARTTLTALLVLSSVAPLHAAGRVVAFGDSITAAVGFDDPDRPEPGYPLRVEEQLPAYGLVAEVANAGKGGEDTTQGLTRIDTVLESGDAMLLLMEGTNDISREISLETTLFDLDQMAAKAEALGLVAVHATLIPRSPTAKVDSQNHSNAELAAGIYDLAATSGRPLVDPFAAFYALPHLFQDYYSDKEGDPVGHPNDRGFEVLADLFLPVVVEDYPRIDVEIAVQSGLVAGELVSFGAVIDGEAESTRWSFGDGGFAWGGPGSDFGADYLFTEPGVYQVKVEVVDRFGRVSEAIETVEVAGGTVTTVDTRSLLQAVSVGGNDGATGCTWLNTGTDLALVELSFVPRGNAPAVLPLRKLALAPNSPVVIDDLLGELFARSKGEGSMRVRGRGLGAAPRVDVTCRTVFEFEEPEGSVYGHVVGEDAVETWSSAPKSIAGVLHGNSFSTVLRAVNLDGESGVVTVELFDAAGVRIGSPVQAFRLKAHSMRERRLVDVIKPVRSLPGTYTARFTSSGIRFVASATVTDSTSDDTLFMRAHPGTDEARLYVPRVVRGQGWPGIQQTTRLMVHNPGSATTQLDVDLLAKPTSKTRRRQRVGLSVGPGETLVWDDVLLELFDRDSVTGALRVDWSNPLGVAPVMQAVVLDQVDGMRLGHAIEAVGEAALVDGRAQVYGVEMSGTERSSLGLLNLATRRTGVRLTLRTPGGLASATAQVSLSTLLHYERNLTAIFPGLGKGSRWLLEVEVLQGGPVLPYLLRSNVSGDAFLLPFEPLE